MTIKVSAAARSSVVNKTRPPENAIRGTAGPVQDVTGVTYELAVGPFFLADATNATDGSYGVANLYTATSADCNRRFRDRRSAAQLAVRHQYYRGDARRSLLRRG